MTTPELLANLPDSHPCYIPGVGECTVGQVRAEQVPALDTEWEQTLEMWADICTRNLGRDPCKSSGATQSAGRA